MFKSCLPLRDHSMRADRYKWIKRSAPSVKNTAQYNSFHTSDTYKTTSHMWMIVGGELMTDKRLFEMMCAMPICSCDYYLWGDFFGSFLCCLINAAKGWIDIFFLLLCGLINPIRLSVWVYTKCWCVVWWICLKLSFEIWMNSLAGKNVGCRLLFYERNKLNNNRLSCLHWR